MLKEGGLLCPQPDCGMGIIPPPIVEGHEEKCRKIQCIGGCGVRNFFNIFIKSKHEKNKQINNWIFFIFSMSFVEDVCRDFTRDPAKCLRLLLPR